MNWTRGLLRLWLLFSAVWVAACLALAVAVPPRSVKYEMADANKEQFLVIAPADVTPEEITQYFIGIKKMNRPECAPDRHGPWCDGVTTLEMPRPMQWVTVAAAAGIPLILLGGGAALVWVIRGFSAPV